jgi:hypothetical protein
MSIGRMRSCAGFLLESWRKQKKQNQISNFATQTLVVLYTFLCHTTFATWKSHKMVKDSILRAEQQWW